MKTLVVLKPSEYEMNLAGFGAPGEYVFASVVKSAMRFWGIRLVGNDDADGVGDGGDVGDDDSKKISVTKTITTASMAHSMGEYLYKNDFVPFLSEKIEDPAGSAPDLFDGSPCMSTNSISC